MGLIKNLIAYHFTALFRSGRWGCLLSSLSVSHHVEARNKGTGPQDKVLEPPRRIVSSPFQDGISHHGWLVNYPDKISSRVKARYLSISFRISYLVLTFPPL